MDVKIETQGIEELMGDLARYSRDFDKDSEQILRQAAREVCVESARSTRPFGLTESAAEAESKAIEAEVKQLFPVVSSRVDSDARRVASMIRPKSRALATQFLISIEKGDTAWTRRIMRKVGLPRGVQADIHQQIRRKSRGVPSAKRTPLAVVTPNSRGAYIRRRQKTVGKAKGGWHQAAKALGGRLRTKGANGKSVNRLPKFVTRHRGTDLGGAQVKRGRNPSVRIWNSVPYIESVFPKNQQARAMAKARKNLVKAFTIQISKLKKRSRRR